MVREGIGAAHRIGYEFLFPCAGYGGSCFPKDVQALTATGSRLGVDTKLLRAVEDVNYAQKSLIVEHVLSHYCAVDEGESLLDKRFYLWGLAFKPQTDDMREAPSLTIAGHLVRLGASIKAFDPEALGEARKILGDSIEYAVGPYEAAEGADALILVTEWNAFRRPSWTRLKTMMRGHVVFDGRNIYTSKRLSTEGFEYYGIGRK